MTNSGQVIDLAEHIAKRLKLDPPECEELITRSHRHHNYFRECLRYLHDQRRTPNEIPGVSPEAS